MHPVGEVVVDFLALLAGSLEDRFDLRG